MRCLDEMTYFLAVEFLFDGDVRTVERWMLKDGGRLSVHDGLLDVAWFCVCKLGGSLAGDECKLGGGW